MKLSCWIWLHDYKEIPEVKFLNGDGDFYGDMFYTEKKCQKCGKVAMSRDWRADTDR